MVPFDVVHENLPSLHIRHLNHVLEQHSYLTTFAKWAINPSFLVLVTLNHYLLPDEFLNVQKLFTEKVLYYQSVVVVQSVNNSCLVLLFEQFHLWLRVLWNYMSHLSVECNTTHLFLNVDIKLVPDHMIVQRKVHLFLKGDYGKYWGLFVLLHFLFIFILLLWLFALHFGFFFEQFLPLIDFINQQILFLWSKLSICWIKQSQFTHDSLMTWDDMKFCFIFDGALVESDRVHINYELTNVFQWARNACQSTLNLLAFDLSHQQCNSVTLFCCV